MLLDPWTSLLQFAALAQHLLFLLYFTFRPFFFPCLRRFNSRPSNLTLFYFFAILFLILIFLCFQPIIKSIASLHHYSFDEFVHQSSQSYVVFEYLLNITNSLMISISCRQSISCFIFYFQFSNTLIWLVQNFLQAPIIVIVSYQVLNWSFIQCLEELVNVIYFLLQSLLLYDSIWIFYLLQSIVI